MNSHLRSNSWLLALTVAIGSVLYPLVLWAVGQTVFPHQANGSLLDENGRPVTDPARARGSRLIGQLFKGAEYFQPRPSSAGNGYDASQSGASNWGASNPLLRSRVARALGPIMCYADTSPIKPGELVGEDIEQWFRDQCQADKNFVATWAATYAVLAERYVNENPQAMAAWLKANSADQDLADYRGQTDDEALKLVKGDNAAAAKLFFPKFAAKHPGYWPAVEDNQVQPIREKSDDIKGYFFDLWLQNHPSAVLEQVPADMVMASGSGLDPHITVKNADYQLRHRVAGSQAEKMLEADPTVARLLEQAKNQKDQARRKPIEAKVKAAKERVRRRIEARIGKPLETRIREVIQEIIQDHKEAPFGGLAGEEIVNVLELNLAVKARLQKLQENQ